MRSDDLETRSVVRSSEDRQLDYARLTDTVRELVQVMRDGEIEHLDIAQGDLRIQIFARQPEGATKATTIAPQSNDANPPPQVERDSETPETFVITAPMVGTFYEASSPGERPFVVVGDRVEAGQTVAIIEAMKIMNEIVADRPGVVGEIMVLNGESVEYGHPLIRLRHL